MMLIRLVCAVLALAIVTTVTPSGRSIAATNQVVEMPNGLKYTDTKTGDGATATAGSKVSVHYTGWLYNNDTKGAKFDSSVDRGQPFQFTLGSRRTWLTLAVQPCAEFFPAGSRCSPMPGAISRTCSASGCPGEQRC